jgi:DNA adenine methylase
MQSIEEPPDANLTQEATPFLRWVGGKQQLIGMLLRELPKDARKRRYVEPFLGAGSLFFAHAPESALLADANRSLIAAFEAVRERPNSVLRYLRSNIARHGERHYYKTRAIYNKRPQSSAQAARFIYLNMACFNGIFRVNQQGKFNVPKGSKDKLKCPPAEKYLAISKLLKGVVLKAADFSETLESATANDFVYLDPPYPALNDTAYFAHYTSNRFGDRDQKVLADRVRAIHNLGIPFLLSNADVPNVRELYKGFRLTPLPVKRYVSCKGKRTAVMELLIRNY